jgi:hypothetical protein
MQLNVLIAGHIDLTVSDFETHYVPDIEALISLAKEMDVTDLTFYMGGANGTDALAQEYLNKQGHKVFVCDKGEQCNAMIVFLRKTPYSLGSSSFHSLVSQKLGIDTADAFQEHTRSGVFGSIEQCIEEYDSDILTLTELAAKVLVIY